MACWLCEHGNDPKMTSMCGFVCLWNIDDEELAQGAMIARSAHRGPDATPGAAARHAPVIMAHARLSIIGPDNGAQAIYQVTAGSSSMARSTTTPTWPDLRRAPSPRPATANPSCTSPLGEFALGLRGSTLCSLFVLATSERIIAARDPLRHQSRSYMARSAEGVAVRLRLKKKKWPMTSSTSTSNRGDRHPAACSTKPRRAAALYRTRNGAHCRTGLSVEATGGRKLA